jgi:alanine racemase
MSEADRNRGAGRAVDLGGVRATRAFVDLDAIAGNVRAIQKLLPDSTQIMAIVKANAYGHGAPWVARTALAAGATSLGVATVGEGHTLRKHGIEAPILVLGAIDPGEVCVACMLGLEITVAGDRLLDEVQRTARELSLPSSVVVHLKLDTGLRRYGSPPEQALSLATRIAADPTLRFGGLYTHFASADEPDEPFTAEQLVRFERACAAIRDAGAPPPPLHAANSAGILTGQGASYDCVRLGISLYGVPPSDEVSLLSGMRPAMRIESKVARVIRIDPGDTVGYNRTFRATEPLLGALVPIGYADGYRRSLSGRGWVGIQGQRANVLGRVSMDQIVVEVPRGQNVEVGEAVHVLGTDATLGAPSVGELARLMETNTYEVLVGIRRRVPRVYVRDGELVGIETAND